MRVPTTTRFRGPKHISGILRRSDNVRRRTFERALAHLLERRSAVDNLIRALERYEGVHRPNAAKRS